MIGYATAVRKCMGADVQVVENGRCAMRATENEIFGMVLIGMKILVLKAVRLMR